MEKDYEEMNWSDNYTHNEQKIYIAFESKDYILCSYNENLTKKFKLSKSIFNL